MECISIFSANMPIYLDIKNISWLLYNGDNQKILDFYKNNNYIYSYIENITIHLK